MGKNKSPLIQVLLKCKCIHPLQVYSGFRFIQRAVEQKKPVAILNIGETRADKLASFKIEGRCGDVLPHIDISKAS